MLAIYVSSQKLSFQMGDWWMLFLIVGLSYNDYHALKALLWGGDACV